MRAYEIGEQSGLESLRQVERPDPVAGHGQAVVAIQAVSLNHRDLMIARGQYGQKKAETLIPLSDGAGTVVAVGDGVMSVEPGDRVIATHFTDWLAGPWDPAYFASDLGNTVNGTLAERVVLPASSLVEIPDTLSFEDACTLPVAANTAWHAIRALGQIKAGDTVLTLGTGGVSVVAVQLAKISGARAAITSSSDSKLKRMRDLGADITVNYKSTPDWDQAVLEQTGGRGADIIVETGGTGTLGKSLGAAAPNGKIGLIGALDRSGEYPNLMPMLIKNVTIKGITSGSRRMLADVVKAVTANRMEAVIDKVFSFDEAPEAYKYLAGASHVGKVVISW